MILLNGNKITPTIFPDGTSQVWKIPKHYWRSGRNTVTWEFQNEGEIMHLAQLSDLLYEEDITATLYLPYLPYARQDKDVDNEKCFALKSFANIIDRMAFDEIEVLDAHSDAFERELSTTVSNIYPAKEIQLAVDHFRPDVIALPDAGAAQRYDHFEIPTITGEKTRDESTGRIIAYTATGADIKGKRVLMVDDICDGGATFILLAEMLIQHGATEVGLYTTHGIYSKGLNCLRNAGIKQIFNRNGEVK